MTYCGFISCVVFLWFDVCWCYGVVRLGWCGILMQAEALVLQPAASVSHKLLKMNILTFKTCSAVNSEIIKRVTSSWCIFIQVYLEFSHVPSEYVLKCTSKTKLIYDHRFIKLHYQPKAYEDLEIRVFLHESETSVMVHINSVFIYGTRKITDLLQ